MVKLIMISSSSQLIYSKNQMNMVGLIIVVCTLMSTFVFLSSNIHWFSLMILLIYISGIMVLFMFIVSLAPNEKSNIKPMKQKKFISMILISIFMYTNLMASNSMKINSMMEWSIMFILSLTLMIMVMAYLPPKMMNSFYKGMKTSK